ncbi:MAG: DUF3108 domain-containing protein [Kiritimatiellia bacterium]|jgi:hypothetical protein|nr:DUF3108 domain-containing protein [Kiritimatiellia bacterium]
MKNIPKSPKNCHFKLFLAVFGVILAIFGHFSTVFGEKSLPGLPWDDPPPELWFPVGEVIEYDVLWGLFTVGEATASAAWTNRDGRRLLTLIVEAETNGIVDKLYPVKEYLETILDPVTFLPLSFEKRSREGRRHYDEITTFDHERLEGHWKSLTKNTEKIFPIKPDTRDLMGLMYWIRKTPIQAGETHHYEVMTDEKLYGVVVEAGKKEKVSLKRYGKVKCIKMEPKGTFDGMFVRKGRLWLWLSDDERYTICRAAASVPVASIKIMLKRVRGPGDDFWVAPR